MRPPWSNGSAGSPTQTSAPRGSKLGGGTLALFHCSRLWFCHYARRSKGGVPRGRTLVLPCVARPKHRYQRWHEGTPLLATFCLCDIALDVIAPTSSVFNGRDCNFVVFDIFLFWVFHVFSLHLCFFLSLVYFFVSFQRFLRIYDFPFNWLRILLISV